MSTEELLAEALRLPRNERAKLAEEVWSSLEEPEEQVAAAWATGLHTSVTNGPITYELDGVQYLVVGAGDSLYAFAILGK